MSDLATMWLLCVGQITWPFGKKDSPVKGPAAVTIRAASLPLDLPDLGEHIRYPIPQTRRC